MSDSELNTLESQTRELVNSVQDYKYRLSTVCLESKHYVKDTSTGKTYIIFIVCMDFSTYSTFLSIVVHEE